MQPACNALPSRRAPSARPASSPSRANLLASALLSVSVLAACSSGKPPSSLSYANSSAVFTIGTPVTDAPSVSGGPVAVWGISPALPTGLGFDTTSGVIAGTPSALSPQTTYTVTATNKDGSTSTTLSITVNDAAPTGLTYDGSPAAFTKGVGGKTLSPRNTGGAITSYTVSPALPAGLSIDAKTGVISGTPTAPTPQASYTVTGSNVSGTSTATVLLSVNDSAPATLSYAGSPFLFTKGTAVTAITPALTGGTPTSFTVTPGLPAGLTLDPVSGVLSGTPTVTAPVATYTITASNVSGLVTTQISIAVQDAAPAGLSYAGSPAIYTKFVGKPPLTPVSTGGPILSYSISPTLPQGLSINTSTGVIFGTPIVVTPQKTYTVTATNGSGSTTAAVIIAVNDVPPGSLSYPAGSVVLTRGTAASPLSPTVSGGGAVTGFTVTPALPAGLTIDPSTGVFSGTPSVISPQASYTISANNSGGSATTTLVVTVKDIAPANLRYDGGEASYTFTKGRASTTSAPTSTGGPIVSYSVTPALPAGLSINATTGVISGTPTALAAGRGYTVTGSNTGGTTSTSLYLRVVDVAPAALAYPQSSYTFTVGQAIQPQTPTTTGGAVVSYSVTPALPAGLSIDSGSGVLSGTPSAVTPAGSYVVRATNSGGSTTATLNITVNDAAPTALSYGTVSIIASPGTAITPDSPTSSGGAITKYTVSPALPAGLSIDPATGIISGTPNSTQPQTSYTITGMNSGGSTTTTVSITVNPAAPTNLVYSQNPVFYPTSTTITPNTPSFGGGAPTSYSVSPALPAGLTLDPGTGIISGTTTATESPAATYVVTATNATGSTTASVVITVGVPPTFTQQPANTTVNVGATATFTVATSTTHTGTTTYQWYRNGVAIPSSTSASYTTPATVASDDGAKFTVVATDGFGATATSAAAVLTVLQGIDVAGPTMDASRAGHVAVTLLDGRVLFAAGNTSPDEAAIYDPSTGVFTSLGSNSSFRYHASATRLGNGKVLILGGSTNQGTPNTTAEIFDPATNTFTATASPNTQRYLGGVVTLQNGNALALGNNNSDATAEIYDQTAGTWTVTGGAPSTGRVFPSLVLLPSGKVLVLGGGYTDSSVDLFDPAANNNTGGFTALAPLNQSRQGAAAALLQDGRVLVVGGQGPTGQGLQEAEVYDPLGNNGNGVALTVGQPISARYNFFTATTLLNGKVLVAGGLDANNAPVAALGLFDPVTATFSSPASMTVGRSEHTATLLPNGKVLIAGGANPGAGKTTDIFE